MGPGPALWAERRGLVTALVGAAVVAVVAVLPATSPLVALNSPDSTAVQDAGQADGPEANFGLVPVPGLEAPVGPAAPMAPASATQATPARPEGQAGLPAHAHPEEIAVPSLDIRAPVGELGLTEAGSLEVPEDWDATGYYTGGPKPGELGPAVIAGHVDSYTGPAVFYRLHEAEPGTQINVHYDTGHVATFTISHLNRYPKDEFPTEKVYGNIDHAGLRLITCGGEYDQSENSYKDNVVAYARLVSTTAGT